MRTRTKPIALAARLAAGLALGSGTFLVPLAVISPTPAAADGGHPGGTWSGSGDNDGGGSGSGTSSGGGGSRTSGSGTGDHWSGGGGSGSGGTGWQGGGTGGSGFHRPGPGVAPHTAPVPPPAAASTAPHNFAPHEFVPHESVPHETAPHETAAHEHDPHSDPAVNIVGALGMTGGQGLLTAAVHAHHAQLTSGGISQPLPLAALVGAPLLVGTGLIFARRRRPAVLR